ncbi:MAG TPA: protein translocase subunit SecF [Vicinamibacteria bacterium]
MDFIKNPQFDFLGKARFFVALSLLLIAVGIGYIVTQGVRFGVEFSGGTQVIVRFTTSPAIDRVRSAVEKVAPGAVIQTYGLAATNQVLIRVAGQADAGPEAELDTAAQSVRSTLARDYADNPVIEHSTEIVGAVVGAELRQKAVQLTVLGLLFQLIYIAIRFKGGIWGVAATLAAVHDVLICFGLLTIVGYEITLNVIAALLTLVGYSVNDTIVIFDRVRENLRQRRKEPLAKILNDSLNQTLTRTLISNGTTFLAVLGLYLFGGEVLRGFGFTMVVGILVGTYSTIYIAIPLVSWWTNYSDGRKPPVAKAAL